MPGEVNPIKIYDGIRVDLIKRDGSEAQKEAVILYDLDMNGRLEGDEATTFENTTFELEQAQDGLKKLKMTLENEDGNNQVTEFIYSDSKDLERCNMTNNCPTVFTTTKASKLFAGIWGIYKKASINLMNNQVTLYGAGKNTSLTANQADVKIENSDMEYIIVEGGRLDLKNTKNYRKYLPDGTTSVQTDGSTTITSDDNSEFDIEILEKDEDEE